MHPVLFCAHTETRAYRTIAHKLLASLCRGERSIAKNKPDVDVWMLLLDVQMFGPIFYCPNPFAFDEKRLSVFLRQLKSGVYFAARSGQMYTILSCSYNTGNPAFSIWRDSFSSRPDL